MHLWVHGTRDLARTEESKAELISDNRMRGKCVAKENEWRAFWRKRIHDKKNMISNYRSGETRSRCTLSVSFVYTVRSPNCLKSFLFFLFFFFDNPGENAVARRTILWGEVVGGVWDSKPTNKLWRENTVNTVFPKRSPIQSTNRVQSCLTYQT